MQLPRDTARTGVVHVHLRETRRPVGRLAAVRHYLPAYFRTGVIGVKSPGTIRFPEPPSFARPVPQARRLRLPDAVPGPACWRCRGSAISLSRRRSPAVTAGPLGERVHAREIRPPASDTSGVSPPVHDVASCRAAMSRSSWARPPPGARCPVPCPSTGISSPDGNVMVGMGPAMNPPRRTPRKLLVIIAGTGWRPHRQAA
jgi:hypothetical protein